VQRVNDQPRCLYKTLPAADERAFGRKEIN
jgi:hypothetical protein